MRRANTSLNQLFAHQPIILYLAVVALVLALVSLHTYHFSGREYRQDEAWAVHGTLTHTLPEVVEWMAHNIHPPGWRGLLDFWVDTFGHQENITRFLSTCFTLITFAAVFRLATDLFNWQVALLAVFLLGTQPLFQYFSHEIRPYALLTASAVVMQWAFMRWLRRPVFSYALLVVVAGITAVYGHYYGLMVVAGLVAYTLIFVRWQWGLYLRAFGLFAAIGLAFSAWLPPFLHSFLVIRVGGVGYALSDEVEAVGSNLESLYALMRSNPPGADLFLIILGIITPLISRADAPVVRFRFGAAWRKLYVLGVPVLVMALALGSNIFVSTVTARNMIIVLPSLAIVAALGLYSLTWRPRWVLIVAIGLLALFGFRPEPYALIGPHHAIVDFMAETYQPGSPIVVESPSISNHITSIYYLREQMPVAVENETMFHVTLVDRSHRVVHDMPDPPVNFANSASEENLTAFSAFLGAEQVFLVKVGTVGFWQPFLDVLEAQYIPLRQQQFSDIPGVLPYEVVEYRRIPNDLSDLFIFGDDLRLQNWRLLEAVQVTACQTIHLESWWSTTAPLPSGYHANLVLAGTDGIGISRNDEPLTDTRSSLWQVGRPYRGERALTLPCDLAAGEYVLLLDVFDPITLDFLPAALPDAAPLGTQVYLTTLFVE